MPAGPMKISFCPSERRAKSRKADAEGWLFLGSKVPLAPAIRLAQPQAAGAVPDSWIMPANGSGTPQLLARHFLAHPIRFCKLIFIIPLLFLCQDLFIFIFIIYNFK